uniref:Uncharacterized protein n=1 Tax=Candidatus Kentrum sp. LPFa TaxID=2126335 RepID=A0A450WPB6_9GAMM|nr:MAG: hypothetical protein BECKLPF1236B_GA0070989_11557 [Candidatus Kentron sp. LPFa]
MRCAYPPYAGTFFICWGDETLNMIVSLMILRFSLDIPGKLFHLSRELQSAGAGDEVNMHMALQVTAKSMENTGTVKPLIHVL